MPEYGPFEKSPSFGDPRPMWTDSVGAGLLEEVRPELAL